MDSSIVVARLSSIPFTGSEAKSMAGQAIRERKAANSKSGECF